MPRVTFADVLNVMAQARGPTAVKNAGTQCRPSRTRQQTRRGTGNRGGAAAVPTKGVSVAGAADGVGGESRKHEENSNHTKRRPRCGQRRGWRRGTRRMPPWTIRPARGMAASPVPWPRSGGAPTGCVHAGAAAQTMPRLNGTGCPSVAPNPKAANNTGRQFQPAGAQTGSVQSAHRVRARRWRGRMGGCGPQWPPPQMWAHGYWRANSGPPFLAGARANRARAGRPQGACTHVLSNGMFFVILACPRWRRDRSDIHGCLICGWQQRSSMRFYQLPRTALPIYLRSGPYLPCHMPLDTGRAPLTCRLLGGLFVSGQGRSACLGACVCVWHASGRPVGVPGLSVLLSPQRSPADCRHLIG